MKNYAPAKPVLPNEDLLAACEAPGALKQNANMGDIVQLLFDNTAKLNDCTLRHSALADYVRVVSK